MTLWTEPAPLVLASKSGVRRKILEQAGLPVEIKPAGIDERAVEAAAAPGTPADAALLLAREKANAVSAGMQRRLVLGADQTLAFGSKRFSKPADRAAARVQLRELSGQTHALHSAIVLMRDGKVLFEHCAKAELTMRKFSDEFLDDYLDTVGAAVFTSVGAYQYEGPGIQLFETIIGDYFTILGLPVLPLLDFLRRDGALAK